MVPNVRVPLSMLTDTSLELPLCGFRNFHSRRLDIRRLRQWPCESLPSLMRRCSEGSAAESGSTGTPISRSQARIARP